MADDALHFAGFDVAFRGRSVDVIVHPRPAGQAPPSVDAIVAALKRTPLERAPRDLIGRSLEAADDPALEVRIPVGQLQATTDNPAVPCAIMISADALAAYAVPAIQIRRVEAPAPADGGGDDGPDAAPADGDAPLPSLPPAPMARTLSATLLRQLLAAANVTTGIREDVVAAFGMGEPLTRITCVALGDAPIAGTDAELEYHFDRNPRLVPRERADGSVDFHSMLVERFVADGAVLVTRHPSVAEQAGQTVLGERLLMAPPRDVLLPPLIGEHTEVRGDHLVATLGGRPMANAAGRIDIIPVYEVAGDLGYSVGNIDFPGDVIIRGDVRPGFAIAATGSIVVQGLVESASLTAGQDLTVMGVVGERWSVFVVGGDLTAQYLHTTEAHVTGTVQVAREIMNCRIEAQRVAMNANGRLVGGTVTAQTEIDAGAIGAANGTLTEVTVLARDPGAVIRARRAAHPGIVVRVGGGRREIADVLEAVSFWDVAGTVLTLRAGAEEHEARTPPQASGAA